MSFSQNIKLYTGTMTFDDSIKLIEDGKYTHLKVVDTDGKKIIDLNAENYDNLISQLQSYKGIFSSYGRLKFIVANDSIYKQNWKDAFNWTITFSMPTPGTPAIPQAAIGSLPHGYISGSEAALMAKVEGMTREMEFNKRFDELNKKLEANNNDPIEKYLPILGLFANLDEKKISNMMALAQMQGLQKGLKPSGIAGLQEVKAELKTTGEEKKMIDEINDEMGALAQKVELSSIHEFVKTLNAKPELLQTLIGMAKNFKT